MEEIRKPVVSFVLMGLGAMLIGPAFDNQCFSESSPLLRQTYIILGIILILAGVFYYYYPQDPDA
jgi:sulfite exporter TauE/SafE